MLIDKADITISGGHGGAGKVSFGKQEKSGPDGGNGGDGGDFYIKAVSDLTLLNQFSKETEFAAQDGEAGKQNIKSGKKGKDFELLLPVGTTLTETSTERSAEFTSHGEVYELTEIGQRILIAKGGLGGKGNWEFRSPRRTTPTFAQSGLAGEKRNFHVDLKLIADFGLVGLPNAGKSSLLNEITNAKAKIGNFAFTTLSPNLGKLHDYVIADIPGLIEGAHEGKGLGTGFLKHIEKVKVILHCISTENENLLAAYKLVRSEMKEHNPELVNKKEVIVLTKSDIVETKDVEKMRKTLSKENKNVVVVSIHDYESLENFKKTIISLI